MSDQKIRNTINKVKQEHILEYGKYHCMARGHNVDGQRIDPSHIIGVGRCKAIGKPELAYDPNNIQMECRSAHREWEDYSPAVRYHKNLDVKVAYLKQHDLERYNILMDKLEQ